MKLISFCEKHLLARHIKKSENRSGNMTLVPHLPRKPTRHNSCGCNGGHQRYHFRSSYGSFRVKLQDKTGKNLELILIEYNNQKY